jgi:hypothetical protein
LESSWMQLRLKLKHLKREALPKEEIIKTLIK